MSVLDKARQAAWDLHSKAERSGIVAAITGGIATREQIALYWRNLLPVYEALDATEFADPGLREAGR